METGKNHSEKYTGPAGKVWLAGAGPGDAGLLTVKAAELIKSADVIVYDALIMAIFALQGLFLLLTETGKINSP